MIRDLQKGQQEGKSIARIKKELKAKYQNKNNIQRTLKTELHREAEEIRQLHAENVGYTHKIWRSQGDARVRDTCFHNGVIGTKVPIESDFRSCGMKAQRPSDDRLPANESIHCRCWLEYL